MLYEYFNEKLLGLQDVEVEKVEEIDLVTHIYCHLKRKFNECPHCHAMTEPVHDYREQIIKDAPAFGKQVIIHLKKRRYRCSCGKRFAEKNTFFAQISSYDQQAGRLCYQQTEERDIFFRCCQRG